MKVLLMKKLWILGLVLGTACVSWADTSPVPRKLHQPYFLRVQDKIPLGDLTCPDGPIQGSDGKTLDLDINIKPPDPVVMDHFSSPGIFEEVQRAKLSETSIGRFYWHNRGGLDYCHFKDPEGNHWYGWGGGTENFNWILWRGHRYWWKDSFAGLWLYYYQGSWWRADGQKKNLIQACVDGEYYACDAQGNVLQDMGQDGSGSIVSAPGRYQGDSHGGHGGHQGGHGGHNGGQPSQGSPQGGNPSSGQSGTSSGPSPGSPSGN